jgi:hypothetical protein
VPYTRAGFESLLEAALAAGYTFAPFDRVPDAARVCLMRHDVDAELGAAVELARIEQRVGVQATYFCMLRSPLYNVFGRGNVELVHEIVSLGHAIGLHYDVGFAPPAGRTHEETIAAEATALRELVGTPIGAVSFHQPASNAETAGIATAGLTSAFDLPGFKYFSDANKADGFQDLRRVIRDGTWSRIQVLIHPIWWANDDPSVSTEDLWDSAVLANLERSQRQLVATERAFGPARRLDLSRP